LGHGSSKELVKAHENAELAKGPKGPKESKWAKDVQCNQKSSNDYTESLKEE